MEILVIAMISLFIALIVIIIALFAVLKQNRVNKSFDKKIKDEFDDYDDDDGVDEENSSIGKLSIPVGFNNEYQKKIVDENSLLESSKVENNVLEIKETVDNPLIEQIEDKKIEINENKVEQTPIINEEKKLEEVVNILINKKNYIFLANNHIVNKNEHLKVIINGKVYFGIVTKANYERDITTMKNKPKKLNIALKKEKKEEIEIITDIDNLSLLDNEFIPKKKKKSN